MIAVLENILYNFTCLGNWTQLNRWNFALNQIPKKLSNIPKSTFYFKGSSLWSWISLKKKLILSEWFVVRPLISLKFSEHLVSTLYPANAQYLDVYSCNSICMKDSFHAGTSYPLRLEWQDFFFCNKLS